MEPDRACVLSHRPGQSGFTLLELLVVVAVLGVLGGVTVFAVGALGDDSQEVACSTDERVLRTAQQASLATDGSFGDEDALVDRGWLQAPSELHDVEVDADGYRILAVGDCADGDDGPIEVAAEPAPDDGSVNPSGPRPEDRGAPRRLTDGQRIPLDREAAPAEPRDPRRLTTGQRIGAGEDRCAGRVDLNRANAEELERIIHIGPTRAKLIIEARPFRSVEQLDDIRGLGPARVGDIRRQGVACV